MSTTTSACCTTAVRAACSKPSSGTAARPKPRANRCASSAPKTVKPWSNLWSPSDARHAHDPSPNPLCRRAGAAGRRPCPCPGSGCQHGHSLLQHGRSEEHTSELQSPCNLVCRLLLEKKKSQHTATTHP